MKKILFIILFFSFHCVFSQTSYEFQKIEEPETSSSNQQYSKDVNYEKNRSFNDDLKTKYSGKEFNYDDTIKATNPDDKKDIEPEIDSDTLNAGWTFLGMSFRLIIILVIAIVLIVILLRNLDFTFVKMSKYRSKKDAAELISDDDNIDENDYDALLLRAIKNKNFRLATRFYYLSLLKKLSQKEYIEYHKDKTNSDYLFELKDEKVRSNFSYLSYIYSYVWYGEFPVDELKFTTIEEKYQSFINAIK